jgi:hypothetical protein
LRILKHGVCYAFIFEVTSVQARPNFGNESKH